MKIISANSINPLPPVDSKAAGSSSQRAELAPVEVTSDEDMQVLAVSSLTTTDSASDVDLDKVAALREAIGNGTMQVSSEAIYDGLVSSVQEMLGGSTKAE